MNDENISQLIKDSIAMELETAKEAGMLAYMARILVQASLPHNKVSGSIYKRQNGAFKLTIMSDPDEGGLPYGTYPRLLMVWLSTEAVKTQSPHLVLGRSLSEFMHQLGLTPSGGRSGNIARLKDQMIRLFSSYISFTYNGTEQEIMQKSKRGLEITSDFDLWFTPKSPDQIGLFESTVTLGDKFFREVITSPIPVDGRALRALKGSSMKLDIYNFLTYRMSYLSKKTAIPWAALGMQLGSNYKRTRDFKKNFCSHLREVLIVYPEAKVSGEEEHLILYPSKPHIPLLSKR